MTPILSPAAVSVLGELARSRALLAFDFDGTLAPIVADRETAHPSAETRHLLRAVSLLYPCAVISGRARADVAARVAGIPLFAVVGNHGSEAGQGPVSRTNRVQVMAWRAALERALGDRPGIDIEDKRFSIAVHYRNVRSRGPARRSVLRAAAGLPGARVFGGHAVVNVAPCAAPDKESALRDLLRRVGARPVLYVGDDCTDEDVFCSSVISVGVRVGRTGRSSARWYLPRQADIDALLRALLAARTRADGLGDRGEGLVRAVST